jgi:mono/diheme cytochrome c family protein
LLAQGVFTARGADPGVLQAQSPIADPLFAKALPILQKHCIQCHKGDAAQGETSLFQSSGLPLKEYPPELKGLIELSVADNSMPKGNAKLSPEEYQAIHEWAVGSESDRAAMKAALKKAHKSTAIPVQPVPGELK